MIQAGIVGFRGYSGAELLRILSRHPRVTPWRMEHRADATPEVQPRHASLARTVMATPEAAAAEGLDVVFLATPHDVSMELTPALLDTGIRVVDLSGAFRGVDDLHLLADVVRRAGRHERRRALRSDRRVFLKDIRYLGASSGAPRWSWACSCRMRAKFAAARSGPRTRI